MTVNLSALAGAGQQFFDNNGNPLSGGKLWSYAAGTTAPQATYTTFAGNVAHTNPIVLDSAGRVATGEIWLTSWQSYKFVLMTSTNVTLATWDNIPATPNVAAGTVSLTPYGWITATDVQNAFEEVVDDLGASSGASLIGFVQSGSGAVSLSAQNKMRQILNVKDFGAVGDGVADDTAEIQLAIAQAVSSGQTLHFDVGVYLVKDITTTSFNMTADQGAVLKLASGGTFLLDITGGDAFKWENITFDGSNIAASIAYTIDNVDDVVMSNVSVTNFADRCCVFEQSTTNVQIAGGTYFDCTGSDVLVFKSNYNSVMGCHFRDIPQHAVRFGRFSSDAAVDSGCYSTVSGCTFDNVTNDPILCELSSKFITIENNQFFESRNICKISASTDDCHSISVVGNTMRKPKGVVSGFTRGVSATDSDKVVISGNVIDLTGSEVGGVATDANVGIIVGTNSTVSNNIILGASNDAIYVDGNSVASGNTAKDFKINGVSINGINCSITGNFFTSSVNDARGIRSGFADTVATGNIVVLTGTGTIGFSGTSGATNALIVGNNLRQSVTPISATGVGTVSANNIV